MIPNKSQNPYRRVSRLVLGNYKGWLFDEVRNNQLNV